MTRYAPCPVLVARPSPSQGPVLAATDLSDFSLPAIARGRAEAQRRRASFVVVHAVDIGPPLPLVAGVPLGMVPMALSPEVIAEIQRAAKATLSEAMNHASADGEAHVVIGDAAASIVREAEDGHAQLVVIGTHGRTGLKQVALGSVAERVVRATHCSVLVVRLGTTS